MGSPAELVFNLTKPLRRSNRPAAMHVLAVLAPIVNPAMRRYALERAEFCDAQSAANQERAPEEAAKLHQIAAELRDFARRL